jgi:hypothetical protein
MKRKLLVLAGLAAVLAVAVVELHTPDPPRPLTSISKADFSRIKAGMTRQEVVAILGPPSDIRTRETEPDLKPDDQFGTPDGRFSARVLSWRSDTAVVFVCIDESSKACSGVYYRSRPSAENTSDD